MRIFLSVLLLSIGFIQACNFPKDFNDLQDSDEKFTSNESRSETNKKGLNKQSIIDRYVNNYDFDGYILIAEKDEITYQQQAGKINDKLTEFTPFPVGSISKVFTAEVVLNLLNQHNISVKDKITSSGLSTQIDEDISFYHLLTHSSGIPDYYRIDQFANVRDMKMRPDDFVSWVNQFPLDFKPGTSTSYSNSGYNLLAKLASELNNQSYGDLITDMISTPNNLESLRSIDNSQREEILQGFSPGPAPEYLRAPNDLHYSWLLGSGSICASAYDLLKWSQIIKNRLKENKEWKPFGWGIREYNKSLYLEQSGRIPGYASHLKIFPDQDLIIILLSRIESESINSLGSNLTRFILGEEVNLPDLRNMITSQKKTLSDYSGTYKFAPDFFLTVFESTDGLEISSGKNANRSDSSFLDHLGVDQFFFRVGNTSIKFKRNSKGKVDGIYWGDSGPYERVNADIQN